ncbi:MAG: hypothetical protein WAV28_08585 [Sedimentisphaerales bacterium]
MDAFAHPVHPMGGAHPGYDKSMPVGRFEISSLLAFSLTPSSMVSATFAPSVTAARTFLTFFESPILTTARPLSRRLSYTPSLGSTLAVPVYQGTRLSGYQVIRVPVYQEKIDLS